MNHKTIWKMLKNSGENKNYRLCLQRRTSWVDRGLLFSCLTWETPLGFVRLFGLTLNFKYSSSSLFPLCWGTSFRFFSFWLENLDEWGRPVSAHMVWIDDITCYCARRSLDDSYVQWVIETPWMTEDDRLKVAKIGKNLVLDHDLAQNHDFIPPTHNYECSFSIYHFHQKREIQPWNQFRL